MIDTSRRGFLAGAAALAAAATLGPIGTADAQMFGRSAAILSQSYDPAAAAYFDAMAVKPTAAARALINAFIVGRKSSGAWARMRMMIIAMATEQAGLLNIINPAETASNVNGCTFTPLLGWTGDAVSKHIDMGRGFADGSIASLNDLGLGANCNQQNGATGQMYHIGSASASTTAIGARADGANESTQVNDASGVVRTSSNRVGFRSGVRTGATAKEAFFNGVSTGTSSTSSTSIGAGNVTLLRRNTVYCGDRLDLGWWGLSLTAAQILDLYNAFTATMSGLRAL